MGKFLLALKRLFGRIFFILTGKEDNQNISNEFEIRPDSTAEWAAFKRLKNPTNL